MIIRTLDGVKCFSQLAVITPLLVATTQRLPRRAMDSTRPSPGTIWPGDTPINRLGPSRRAIPFSTSRTLHRLVPVGSVPLRATARTAGGIVLASATIAGCWIGGGSGRTAELEVTSFGCAADGTGGGAA